MQWEAADAEAFRWSRESVKEKWTTAGQNWSPPFNVRPEEEDVGSLDHVEHLTGRTERLVGIREAGR